MKVRIQMLGGYIVVEGESPQQVLASLRQNGDGSGWTWVDQGNDLGRAEVYLSSVQAVSNHDLHKARSRG
jgi:hypothetical protein